MIYLCLCFAHLKPAATESVNMQQARKLNKLLFSVLLGRSCTAHISGAVKFFRCRCMLVSVN